MGIGSFVALRELSQEQIATQSPPSEASLLLVLRSLQDPDRMAQIGRFVSKAAAQATGPGVYRTLLAVKGAWDKPPSHAVCAVWEVKDLQHAAAFVESRQQLFALRQHVLSTFAADWLLKHCDQEGRYMVLGFYGDEDGATRLCREHPEIKQFAAAHPASQYTAVDLTGLLCWRIESLTPAGSTV